MEYGQDVELAWAAGFFDGEGWISPNKQANGRCYIVAGVAQKDIRPLERFQQATHSTHRKIHHGRLHQVMFGGVYAVALMGMLWPYLSNPKREQALQSAAIMQAHNEGII